jgi:hypothetical protein
MAEAMGAFLRLDFGAGFRRGISARELIPAR